MTYEEIEAAYKAAADALYAANADALDAGEAVLAAKATYDVAKDALDAAKAKQYHNPDGRKQVAYTRCKEGGDYEEDS